MLTNPQSLRGQKAITVSIAKIRQINTEMEFLYWVISELNVSCEVGLFMSCHQRLYYPLNESFGIDTDIVSRLSVYRDSEKTFYNFRNFLLILSFRLLEKNNT